MNRYEYIHPRRIRHWICVKKFPLEKYYIHPGDIIDSCSKNLFPHVFIKGREYEGVAGLNEESLGFFQPVYVT